jgi:two-component system, NtrC family, sensor histidine kinase HydH
MVMDKKNWMKSFWVMIPPWAILGAVVILVPIFAYLTLGNIHKHKELTTQLLVERGEALIRSFEAGARTGEGLKWGSFQLEKLVFETAQQPGVDYLIITDATGKILADSDPSMVGESYMTDLDLQSVSGMNQVGWRQVPDAEGADTFEVYRGFLPEQEFFGGFERSTPESGRSRNRSGLVIFVGLNMGPVLAARDQDTRSTLVTAVVLLLLGFAGIISLFMAQGYRVAQVSLARMKAFSDSLVEHMPLGLVAVDPAGLIMAFNDAAEALLGCSARDVLGKPVAEVIPAGCCDLIRTLGTDKIIMEKEHEYPVSEGRSILLDAIAMALRDDEGVFMGHVILLRDLTELQHLRGEVERSRRLASIGSLAAGVAHEIRNPLSSIKGFATYFRERFSENPEDLKVAGIMVEEVDRLNRVVGQLLDLSRPMTLARKTEPILPVVQHAIKMVEAEAHKKGISIRSDLAANMPALPFDSDRMTQVFLNLFLNASAAMEPGGVLSVRLSRQDDRTLRVDVSDTGKGISKEDLPRIFDPYFTTRPSGTGLGLAIVHRIIEAHDGEIRVESEPGKGTTFTVFMRLGE